jgi:hypothetical protein
MFGAHRAQQGVGLGDIRALAKNSSDNEALSSATSSHASGASSHPPIRSAE